MRWFDLLPMKLAMLFGRRRAAAHLERRTPLPPRSPDRREHRRRHDAEEARHAALRTFGNPALLRDQARATWNWAGLESVLQRCSLRRPHPAAHSGIYGHRDPGHGPRHRRQRCALHRGAQCAAQAAALSRSRAACLHLRRRLRRQPSLMESLPAGRCGQHAGVATGREGMADMAFISPWQDYNVSAEGGRLPEKIDAAWCSWNFFPTSRSAADSGTKLFRR